MLDQSFSAENFRKIFDIENRKGIYLEGDFYPDIDVINKKIKDINFEIRQLNRKGLPKEKYIEQRKKLEEKKDELRIKKEEKLLEKLNVVSSIVTTPGFKIDIEVDLKITEKPVYKTPYKLEHILALKQLQYNFRKLYKVKQANRYSIISQLKNLIDDGFPKTIIKTDIKEFYESIPHDKLLKKINNENMLTHLSIKFIQQILSKYKIEAHSKKGVPRGIGISPYLTELYMKDIDAKILHTPNVLYYARYVDDIIIIFMPSTDNVSRDYKNEIKKILSDEGLTMNEDEHKTSVIPLTDKTSPISHTIEYLGYKFQFGFENKEIDNNGRKKIIVVRSALKLSISSRKKERYAARLVKAFNLYQKQAIGNEKKARKLFVKRIKFLMSNTRLVNNKRNVITGIYYTNSLINTTADFKILDRFFIQQIRKFGLPTSLVERISPKNSFEAGFEPSHISKFNALELNAIMKNWTK